jgi:hypothetical protein
MMNDLTHESNSTSFASLRNVLLHNDHGQVKYCVMEYICNIYGDSVCVESA